MSITISKTKQKLLEVSRLLFARNGVENTTMNEIAEASGYGRRTLYTHFKNKNDSFELKQREARRPSTNQSDLNEVRNKV